jgi:8-oxo-dGTP pyrophosphatase MutT (NUDIX family)
MTRREALEVLVRGIIRDDEGRVLLVRHVSRGWWFLPGGHLARNESPEQALRRELIEEASLAVDPRQIVGVVEHTYTEESEGRAELNIVLEAHASSGLGAIEPQLQFAWFESDQLSSVEIRPASLRNLLVGVEEVRNKHCEHRIPLQGRRPQRPW